SREYLLDVAQKRMSMSVDRSIDVQVSRLRRKLEADDQVQGMIKTVRGQGYLFTPEVARV
ncbi:winged helix-turn-helix domain-containing protein, partial [Escherichia coli]|uniref:winged helix-turn-helix domain-containing protein n=1 Tax=Escherichia coli TaxID=562 RepID=UPI0013D15898